MNAENFLVDDGGDGKAVEAVGEGLPEFNVVPPFAWVVVRVRVSGRNTSRDATRKADKRACFRRVFVNTFVIEAVDAVDGCALVVPAQQEEVLGVFNFVGK